MEKKEREKEEARKDIKKGMEGEGYRGGKEKKKEFSRHRENPYN